MAGRSSPGLQELPLPLHDAPLRHPRDADRGGRHFKKKLRHLPFLLMPRLGVIEALMYLHRTRSLRTSESCSRPLFHTQSGKDVNCLGPSSAVDLDEVKPTKQGFFAAGSQRSSGPRRDGRRDRFALYLFISIRRSSSSTWIHGSQALFMPRRPAAVSYRHRHVPVSTFGFWSRSSPGPAG